MEKIREVIFIVGILFLTNTYSQVKTETNNSDKQIIEMLKTFYTQYKNENDKTPLNEKKINLIKQKFCTSKLIKKINSLELEYDPFIDAQDFDSKILSTINLVKIMETLMFLEYAITSATTRKPFVLD